ncbi:MAG: hypothetical protein OEZ58_13285, partial [Gammaproteobacteria bacterium]|nr:hypothetical protein [Gammaproteobacteria bacterium]
MKHPIINLIKQSSSIYLQRSFGQLLMFAFMFITLTPVQAAIDGFAQETMEPMIKLELGYTPALCRQPSRFPDNVNQGQLELGCRQMKAVQHWLNLLTNPETLYGSAQQVEGDGIENRHFEIDDYRRQYYFGRYWETFQRNNRRVNDDDCDLVCVSYALYGTPGVVQDAFDNHPNPVELYHPTAVDPIMEDFDEKYDNNYSQWLSLLQLPQFPKQTGSYGFDQVLRETFQRMYAILIASAYPVDRRESSLVSGEWWWELPPYYRDLCTDDLSLSQCLHLRARIMREDVNAWIQNAGIWVYASMGTGSKTWLTKQIYDETGIAPKGGYDFVAIEILNFMYALKDKPSLLFDESIIPLVKKRVDESHSLAMVQQQRIEWAGIDDWDDTIIAFAGPFNSDVLTFRQYVALTNIAFSETENHALIAFAHNYLMNQWILNDYRNNLADQITLPEGFDITSYFSVTGNDVERWTRDALGRVVHNDLFETNALPYQRVSMHPILLLASFSENHTIKTEAENAMHFLATKFSFQSFEGRKSAPMRRNCQYAHELAFYARDAAAYAFGILSGAYKWNDSPYGMRWGTNNPATCLNQPRAQSCYWPHYSWKKEINPDTTVVPTASGEHIFTDEAGFNRYKPGSISSALWFGFGHYRIPPAVHDFMLHKYKGYYARMMAKYDRGAPKESHYRYSTGEPSSNDYPQYFNGDQAYDTALNNERTPEFYFAGQGFLNSSGGVYNPYYTFASNSKEEGYKIPRNPHQTVKSAGCNGNANGEKLENYDFLSRPTLILPQIEYQDIIDDVKFGTVTRVYKPVGLDVNRPAAYLQQFIPMMLGNKENWFKSSNVAVYKNFGYGYKISGRNTSPISSAEYRYIGGESPIDIPEQWKPCLAEKNEIVFGLPKSCDSLIRTYSFDYGTTLFDKKAAHFKLYDLREYLQNKGQTGFYLITASLEKRAGAIHHWSSKVARGFWEVVPMDKQL